jgi:hypothetical protein
MELDIALCRLALYLHPKYKNGITFTDESDSDLMERGKTWKMLKREVSMILNQFVLPSLILKSRCLQCQALTIMKARGSNKASLEALSGALEQYRHSSSPFSEPFLGDPHQWFQSIPLKSEGIRQLVTLALLLLDIVPHAAEPERLFSILRYIFTSNRNNMSVKSLKMISTVKTSYLQKEAEQTAARYS